MAEHGESSMVAYDVCSITDNLPQAEITCHSGMSWCAAHLFLRKLAWVKRFERKPKYTYWQNRYDLQISLSRWELSTLWTLQAK